MNKKKSDLEEAEAMRAAGLPVPTSIEEVNALLAEAEKDQRTIPAKEARRILREHAKNIPKIAPSVPR